MNRLSFNFKESAKMNQTIATNCSYSEQALISVPKTSRSCNYSPFQARAWLTGYKGKFLGSSAVRGTYVCIDTTSPNEDTTSPGAKTTSFLDTTSL